MRTIIGCFMICALLVTQWGCAILIKQPPAPPPAEVMANLGTVGIVSPMATPELTVPEMTARNETSVDANEAIKRGIAGTVIGGLAGALIGGLVGTAVCAPLLLAAPVCGAAGAAYGAAGGAGTGLLIGGASAYMSKKDTQAVAIPSTVTSETLVANAQEALDRAHLREKIQHQVYKLVQRQTSVSPVLLTEGASADKAQVANFLRVETKLELTVTKIGLAGDRIASPTSLAAPYIIVRGKLIRVADNQLLYTNSYEKQGSRRAISDWAEVEPWQQFLNAGTPALANEIVSHLFPTAPAPSDDWLDKAKNTFPDIGKTVISWFRGKSAADEKTKDDPSAQRVPGSEPDASNEAAFETSVLPYAPSETDTTL